MAGLAGMLSMDVPLRAAWLRAALGLLRHAPSASTAQLHGGALGVVYAAPQPANQWDAAQAGPLTLFVAGTIHNVPDMAARFDALPQAGLNRAMALLQAYRAHGLAPLTQLNGDFTIGIWDAAERTLRLITDRWSLQKLYYARIADGIVFASEIKALLAHPGVSRQMDPVALAQALSVGYPLDDRTLYAAVRLVPGGHVLTASLAAPQLNLEPYWQPRFTATFAGALDEQADELGRRLQTAVRRAIGGARRVAVPLSGGWDSRTVLGFARRTQPDAEITGYSAGHSHSHDVLLGRQLARRAGVPHRFVPIREDFLARHAEEFVWLTDGLVTAYHGWYMDLRSELDPASEVVLSGFFGDAVLGFWRRLNRAGSMAQMETANLAEHQLGFSEPELARLFRPGVYRRVKHVTAASLSATLRQAHAKDLRDAAAIVNMLQRQRRCISYPLTTFGSLVRAAAPFADNDVVDLALTLPTTAREDKAAYLRMLCRWLPKLAAVPDETREGVPLSAGRIRTGLYWRWERLCKMQVPRWSGGLIRPHDRRANVHHDEWIRLPETQAYLTETLTSGETYLGEWVDVTQVRALIARHMDGEDLFRHLSGLLTLVLWCRQADRIPVARPVSAPIAAGAAQ